MLVIRYVTLLALVVWLGGLVTLRWLMAPPAELLPQVELVGYACGATILLGLLVLKFVGPPPAGFIPRLTLVSIMLAVTIYARVSHQTSPLPQTIEILVGLPLLFWYVRE